MRRASEVLLMFPELGADFMGYENSLSGTHDKDSFMDLSYASSKHVV